MSIIAPICMGIVGFYGGFRGRGDKVNLAENVLELPPGFIRVIFGFVRAILGIIIVFLDKPEARQVFMFGLAAEFIGVSIPGITPA